MYVVTRAQAKRKARVVEDDHQKDVHSHVHPNPLSEESTSTSDSELNSTMISSTPGHPDRSSPTERSGKLAMHTAS